MIALLAVMGWSCAAAVAAVAVRRLSAARELSARACHEVRGPLTAAGLALTLMERRSEAPAERLAALADQLDRARLAVEDLGAAGDSRRRAAADRMHRVGAATTIARLRTTWAPVFASQGRTLEVGHAPAGLSLHADPTRLSQAAGNLIANALEHGTGDVALRTRVAGGRLRLEVHDQGPGLGKPLAEILRGARGGRGRRGRGLAIAAAIAERHGGRLTTAPGRDGAALVLELPLLADSAQHEAREVGA